MQPEENPPVRLGEYELLTELGSGGMATLYVARHVGAADVERLVAIKRVHRHVLAVPGIQTMFRDEARLAALVRHPNVARVLDVSEVDGELLIVLDYIESVSLAALHAAARAAGELLPVPVVVRVLADALAGLHAAHEATDLHGEPLAIVHRDFSPQNVLVGSDGTSQLIDFGVAKAAVRATQTDSGVLKGKFQYMSPEQARGGTELDRRSDVFAAGIVLFEALTGALPFGNDTREPSAILLRIVLDPFPAPSSLVPGLPPALDLVVERALERVRDERYQSAGEMRDALVAAVPPSSDAEVRAVVERWCQPAIAARRSEIRRVLAGTAPTLAHTPGAARGAATADTVAARPTPARPAERSGQAPDSDGGLASPAPSRGSVVRVAVAAAAIAAVLALVAVGIAVGVLWRDRGPAASGAGARHDAGAVAVVGVAHPAAPADAGMTHPVPADAAIAPPAAGDGGPRPRTHRSHQTVHPAASHPTTSSPQLTAPARQPSPIPGTRPGFTADGALLQNGHEVRLTARLIRNTTTAPDAVIQQRIATYSWYVLVIYRQAVLVYLPKGAAPPEGTIEVTYHLRHNAYVPEAGISSTFHLGRAFDESVGFSAFMSFFGSIFQGGHADITGDIVIEGTYSVR